MFLFVFIDISFFGFRIGLFYSLLEVFKLENQKLLKALKTSKSVTNHAYASP